MTLRKSAIPDSGVAHPSSLRPGDAADARLIADSALESATSPAPPGVDHGGDASGASENHRAKERIGLTLNEKWRLDALLGVGGMASVYAATHRNGSRAALKILHPEFARDRAIRERFLREGYVANK